MWVLPTKGRCCASMSVFASSDVGRVRSFWDLVHTAPKRPSWSAQTGFGELESSPRAPCSRWGEAQSAVAAALTEEHLRRK